MTNEKLFNKIVALAKYGVGWEKENAIIMVKRICKAEGLDYDAVMSEGEQKKDWHFLYSKTLYEYNMSINFLARYGTEDMHNTSRLFESAEARKLIGGRWAIVVNCTEREFVELQYIWEVLLQAYRQETKKALAEQKKKINNEIKLAFCYKHNLFMQKKGDGGNKSEMSYKEYEEHLKAIRLARWMQDVNIRKALN